jgi:SAM-dependent methyltransferase
MLRDEFPAERWDARYQGATYLHGKEPVAFLRDNVERFGSGRALVLAMGEGRNAVFLAQHGFAVTGVDVSARGVEKALALAAERGVSIRGVVGDLTSYDLGRGEWDLITNFFFLERGLFSGIREALKPGGVFILEHFTTEHPLLGSGYGPKSTSHLLEPGELLRAFAGFRFLHYEEPIVDLDDGRHKGPAALVRLIAQKPEQSRP